MKPWAGYMRVSFVGGRSGDSFRSVDDQARDIQRWADARSEHVVLLEPELDGKSNDPNRKILNEAINGVRDGRFCGIVVAYQSRAGRNLKLMIDMWHEVEEVHGGLVMSAADNIDPATSTGRMTRAILASVDQQRRDELTDSFERQCASATERGVWQRRQTPTGYSKDPVTRRLEPNDDARLVQQAFRDRATGRPLVEIARALGLTPSGTRALLRNRVYLGELKVRSYVNLAAHPPIVTVDEFDAAQLARRVRGPRESTVPALLAGLTRCAGCGHVMSRNNLVYGCSVNKSAGRCPEPASVTMTRLDAILERVAILELARLSATAAQDTGDSDRARARQSAARRDLAVFLEVTASAGLEADTLAAGIRQRQEAVRVADDEVRALVRERSLPHVGDPEVFWQGLSVEDQGEFLRGFIEAVVVRRVGRGGTVVPVADRVRVLRAGAGVFEVKAGSDVALPLRSVWPNLNDPRVIRV